MGKKTNKTQGWKFKHAPISESEKDNAEWWKYRAKRTSSPLSTGDSGVDNSKELILSASVQAYNRDNFSPQRISVENLSLRKSLNKKQFVFAETPALTSNNLAASTTTFAQDVVSNDTLKIDPQYKFKPQFRVERTTDNSTAFLGKLNFPIVFYTSSVGTQNTGPNGYFKTTQHLQDYYLETKDIPLQGPFTSTHVGGYGYRHSGLNVDVSTLRREGWYVATSVVGGNTYFAIYNPSHLSVHNPRANYSRDHIAKSYVNIKNIKSVTSSADDTGAAIPLGNYVHDYDIVQTSDRATNNRYFVENDGISTASVASTFISGLHDRAIPDRGANNHIFVNRFSSPGGPETLGAGYLDTESETFSVYNALPYRNLAVRTPLNRTFLRRHSAFGGYDSVLGEPSASFHKTQRNGVKRIVETGGVFSTASVYDNAFVQHMIPQSDMQYSWITASATNVIFGYEQPNNSNASLASTDITFVSASDFGTFIDTSILPNGKPILGRPQDQAGANFHPQSFVQLNYFAFADPTQLSGNTVSLRFNSDFVGATLVDGVLGGAEPPQGLNLQLLASNGAGGFSSWKQVRQADGVMPRYLRKNNTLSIVKETQELRTNDQGKTEIIYPKTLVSYTEPPVSSKYKPLRHQVLLWNYQKEDGTGGEEIIIDSSYANNLAYFTMTNTAGVQGVFDSLTDILGFEPEYAKQVYDDLKRIYINNENGGLIAGANPIRSVPSFTYKEVIYPRESYTFLSKTRMRENYGEASGSGDFNRASGKARTFWRDYAFDRLRSIGFATSAFGNPIDAGSFKTTSYENVIDLSCWPLDANYPVVDIAPTGAAGAAGSATATGQGEGSLNLPTDISLKSLNGELSYNNWIYNLYRVPVQGLDARPTTPSTLNGTSPISASLSYEYPNFALSGNDPNQPDAHYTIAHMSLIPNWTANVTASRNPWFDSYDDYSNDIRRIGKDFTVIPEFRISDHIEYYLKEGFGAVNRKFVDLIGASTSTTASADTEDATSLNEEFYRIYSHTDFMKHFDVLADDHANTSVSKENTTLNPSKIKIKCKGIKKLLPYQGFYPALRTVQLGQLFSSSYGPHLTGNYDTKSSVDGDQQTQQLASLVQPFFAPGIMFNTIKSGIAVDWPVITGSIDEKTPLPVSSTGINSVYGFRAGGHAHFHPDYRLPFEALVSPEKHLPVFNPNTLTNLADRPDAALYHIWPNYLDADLGQSNQARRYSTLEHYGSGAADNYISGSEEFKSWYNNAGYSRPTPNFAWKGEHDSRYNLAMSNFLAETIDFFLEDQQVTTFVSKPEKQFKTMVSGTTYFMDVVLSKTDGFKMYEGPDNLFEVNTFTTASSNQFTSSVGARGMHYGPNFSPRYVFTDMDGDQAKTLDSLQDPAPAPYTPPYFYGTSVARIAFRPHALRDMEPGDSDKFTLSEILASSEIETKYLNFGENSNGKFLENSSFRVQFASAYLNQMHIDSSVNLFQRTGQKKTTYIPVFGDDGSVSYKPNSIVEPDNTENDVWIIESKFECPTLDFSNHNILNTYSNGDGNERQLTTGMWRTFGQIPEQDAGVFLQIKNPFEQITNATDAVPRGTADGDRGPAKTTVAGRAASDRTLSIATTGSLADVCGFDIKKKRVGELAENKVISEAIVAIPINTDGTMVNIPKKAFATQLNNLEKEGLAVKKGDFPGITEDIKRTSITDMIQKMKKFVIPPHLDFVSNKEVDPFVMYIFEFTHRLTKKDLSHIWQNLMPDISLVAEEAESIIEHPILTGPNLEFFGVDPNVLSAKDNDDTTKSSIFPKDIRWMVFKVKQRGKNNYFGASLTQDDNKGFGLSELDPKGKLGVSGKQLTYSYNWPYDFFSLVELGKIETSITFEPTKLDPRDQDDPRLEDRIKKEESERREVSQEVKDRDQVNWATTSVKGDQGKKR